MPEPPMTPSTALVMTIPVSPDWAKSQWRDWPGTERRLYFAALVSERPRARSPARIFARRTRLELLRMQFHVVPHLLLGEVKEPRQHDQENEHLYADALSGLEVRLGGPHQEGGDVLGVLLDRHRRAVGVVDALVRERRRHGDGMAGKIFIVEAAGRKGDARRRRVPVAFHQRGEVVDALLLVLREDIADPAREAALVTARLGDHREIGRYGIVASTGGLVVGKRRRESIGQPAGAILDLALIVGLALDLVFGRDGGRLRNRKTGPARIGKRAERHQLEPMTDLADLAIDLEPALELRAVVFAERPRERPLVHGRRRRFVLLRQDRRGERGEPNAESEDGARDGHGVPLQAFAPAGGGAGAPMGLPSGSTDSEIEFGSGLVLSTLPSTGRITRKKAK